MPDLEFRHTRTFKGLDGQTKPKGNLLDEVFSNAIFKTRFCELLESEERDGVKWEPARLAISECIEVEKDGEREREVEEWYRDVRLPRVKGVKGWVKSRRFRIVDSTVLDEFNRRDGVGCGDMVAYLGLYEFEGEDFPTEIGGIEGLEGKVEGLEVGYFRRKRVYGEFEDFQTKDEAEKT